MKHLTLVAAGMFGLIIVAGIARPARAAHQIHQIRGAAISAASQAHAAESFAASQFGRNRHGAALVGQLRSIEILASHTAQLAKTTYLDPALIRHLDSDIHAMDAQIRRAKHTLLDMDAALRAQLHHAHYVSPRVVVRQPAGVSVRIGRGRVAVVRGAPIVRHRAVVHPAAFAGIQHQLGLLSQLDRMLDSLDHTVRVAKDGVHDLQRASVRR